jgi:hypothetical protein
MNLNRLFIHDSYKTICSSIHPKINKCIITGSPGIGKSVFMIYLLWRMAKEKNEFCLHFIRIHFTASGPGGVFVYHEGLLPSFLEVDYWNDDVWCLFDTK